jgi:hypothetical protein
MHANEPGVCNHEKEYKFALVFCLPYLADAVLLVQSMLASVDLGEFSHACGEGNGDHTPCTT